MAATRQREGATVGMHIPKVKGPFGEYAKVSQASWAERGGKRARPDPRGDFKWKLIFEF
jgi:hypothetical protein